MRWGGVSKSENCSASVAQKKAYINNPENRNKVDEIKRALVEMEGLLTTPDVRQLLAEYRAEFSDKTNIGTDGLWHIKKYNIRFKRMVLVKIKEIFGEEISPNLKALISRISETSQE